METNTTVAVSVAVVTYRGRAFVAECLRSLAAQTLPHDVVVIDNASNDGTADLLAAEFPQLRVLRQATNLGFAGAVAVALEAVRTPYLALLNDDAVADQGWLAALAAVLDASPDVAAVTSRMLLSDGAATTATPGARINNLGVALTATGHGYDIGLDRPGDDAFTSVTEVFGFSGGAAMFRAAALRAVGGSPAHFFLYYEDVDMSWRLRLAGHRIVSAPTALVWHRHSATIGQASAVFHFHNERNRLLTLLRCAPLLLGLTQLLRFVLTTGSLAAKKLLRRPVPPALNFSIALRLRVLRGVLLLVPRTVVDRRAIGRLAVVDRGELAERWLGFDPLALR